MGGTEREGIGIVDRQSYSRALHTKARDVNNSAIGSHDRRAAFLVRRSATWPLSFISQVSPVYPLVTLVVASSGRFPLHDHLAEPPVRLPDQITLISSPMISLVRYPRLLSETPDTLAPYLPGAEATPPLPRVSATCQADGALSC